jgi:tRNA-2-methylthio-N6-dimethylallyladenosine synthase
MAETPTLCEHVHLPAQSGSTRILRRMRRTYSRERYLELLGRIREGIADVSVTTDLIVGFPGETDEDFADTLSLVQEAEYDGAFTFVYSPRPGTEAAETMEDDIPPALKSERIQALIDTVHATSRARARRFVGAEHEALVEGPSRTDPTRLRGRLRQNITVNFSGDAAPGTLAMVKITGASSTTLAGEQVGVHATA